MKRIETLIREGHAYLDATRYQPDYKVMRNGVTRMDVARALDKVRQAERVLRQAFEDVQT